MFVVHGDLYANNKPSWAGEVHEVTREEAKLLKELGAEVFYAGVTEQCAEMCSWELANAPGCFRIVEGYPDFFYIRKEE